MRFLHDLINNRTETGHLVQPIPSTQNSIAGGFFILNKQNIDWWANTYDDKLNFYVENDYLVKDDQIILVDCIFSNLSRFTIFNENNNKDNWFMFQRILN